MTQLLQVLQWMYMHQSSAIPAAAQYLVTQLPELMLKYALPTLC